VSRVKIVAVVLHLAKSENAVCQEFSEFFVSRSTTPKSRFGMRFCTSSNVLRKQPYLLRSALIRIRPWSLRNTVKCLSAVYVLILINKVWENEM